jgi:hypothetical protein
MKGSKDLTPKLIPIYQPTNLDVAPRVIPIGPPPELSCVGVIPGSAYINQQYLEQAQARIIGMIPPPVKSKHVGCPPEGDSHDISAPEDSASCVICLDHQPICIILPCMHKSLCCSCARSITANGTKERGQVKCPMCKADVKEIKRVYE